MTTCAGCELPTYLNEELIRKALEKAYGGSVTIKACDIALASGNGENFCSNTYRVLVKYAQNAEVQAQTLFLKNMLPEMTEIGSNEQAMYEVVLPAMEKILIAAGNGVEKPIKLKPHCLLSLRDKEELYVLEDLCALGYKSADRCLGLDMAHTIVLLQKIAQFHAASMVYIEKQPTEAAALHVAHFANGAADPVANSIAVGGFSYVADMLEQWTDDYAEITAKVRANIATFDARVMALVDPKRSKWNVINHGDLWLNNFLFSYAHEQPEDVIFVDFQNCFVGSLGFDLNYFLYTSVQLPVLQQARYRLLRIYYRTLRATLRLCGASKIPTWQQVMAEVRDCAFIGYYAALCELPVCCMKKEVASGFTAETFSDPEAMQSKRKALYSNERVLEMLKYVLDYFDELRVLD